MFWVSSNLIFFSPIVRLNMSVSLIFGICKLFCGSPRTMPSYLVVFTSQGNKCTTKVNKAQLELKVWLAL
jgi:hypothetical protein